MKKSILLFFVINIFSISSAYAQETETKLSDLINIYKIERTLASPTPAPVPEFQLKDLEDIKLELKINRNPGELGEKQSWLYKNELAPWDGVILNPEAMAIIISEYENLILKSQLTLQTQKIADLSKLNLETGKLRLELDAQKKKSDIELSGRDSELKSCQKINKEILEDRDSFKRKLYLGAGSGALGLAVGLLIGIFAI